MSYFPCDEGLYKKKYCNERDRELITGMEYIIDDVLVNWCDNNAIEDIEDIDISDWETGNDELEDAVEELIDGDRENICLSRGEFLSVVKAIQRTTYEDIERWIEGERGTMLVSCINAEHSGKTNDELVPLWKQSEADEYPEKMTEELEEHYVFNINGKLRPRWNE